MWRWICVWFFIWNLMLTLFNGTYHLILAGMWLALLIAIEYKTVVRLPARIGYGSKDRGPEAEKIP